MTRSAAEARGGASRQRLTVASGAMTIMGGQLAVYGLGFVASILIARAIGAEGRGLYYLPVVAATACTVVFNLSIENASRETRPSWRVCWGRWRWA